MPCSTRRSTPRHLSPRRRGQRSVEPVRRRPHRRRRRSPRADPRRPAAARLTAPAGAHFGFQPGYRYLGACTTAPTRCLLAVRLSVERACARAGITPLQVDLFELYDAYSIFAAFPWKRPDLPSAARPGSWPRTATSACRVRSPIRTLGGLKARGNPGGATGVYQAVEAVQQLRGQAGQNQISAARRALVQCLGGPASTAVTHILERVA